LELEVSFRSLADWLAYRDANPALFDFANFDEWGGSVLRDGCTEPLTRARLQGSQLTASESWREGLAHRGVSSRTRAVMRTLERVIEEQQLSSPRIYAAEGLTAFALRMRGLFPRFIGSEFTLDSDRREWMFPIPFEDVQNLSFATDTFDIVSTNEVLEHVPSIDKALTELCRVLRPGGWHVGTVPFAFMDEKSIRRAVLNERDEIEHLLEPEYHGDPMGPSGVLVFETPGWDLVDRALRAGFSHAEMRFIVSLRDGIVSEHIGGVFVFCCQK
jgi:SAM-dependent methyltransferase